MPSSGPAAAPAADGRTQRWALGVEYLGGAYAGWQRQGHCDSVQGRLEAALSSVADHAVDTICAGRTDAGVHAFGQVVHFDSAAARRADAWCLGCNSRLPADISVRWARPVASTFSARFSATARRYRYVVFNDRARSALVAGRATWLNHSLDADAMHRAAQALLGEQDFSAFRAAECQSTTPMRNLQALRVARQGRFVIFDVQANAFLHHMVRNLVGSLLEVGSGRRPEAWIAELLAGRDRTRAGMTAAAHGLYFVGPDYPPAFGLPAPEPPWFPAAR